MKSRGRVRAAIGACIVAVFAFVAFTFVVPVAAQQNPKPSEPKKLDKEQLKDAQALSEAVDAAMAGKPAPSEIPVKAESFFFFRGANGRTYVPFTLVVDPTGLASQDVVFMVRAVKKEAAAAPTAAGDKGAKPAATPGLEPEFVTLKAEGNQAKVSRALQVLPGDYDLLVGVKEKNPADKKQKAKISVYRQELKVPDYSPAVGFVTSALVVTDKMDVLPAVLKADEQRVSPYTLGQLQFAPKLGTSFAKTQELCIYYQIYNAGLDSANKPDVLIEYEFLRGEKKVVNAEPQILNAGTLPKDFDGTKHLLAGPEAWPLSGFPPGEYKLNVKITDKTSGKSITHTVNFTVA